MLSNESIYSYWVNARYLSGLLKFVGKIGSYLIVYDMNTGFTRIRSKFGYYPSLKLEMFGLSGSFGVVTKRTQKRIIK